jgi:hypothetical protein
VWDFKMKKIICMLACIFANSADAVIIDFSNTDGGFTSSGTPSWNYTGTNWETAGSTSTNENFLTSSSFTVDVDGDININLNHAYDFERPSDFFDGGLFEASINGAAYSIITPSGGYPTAASTTDGCDEFGFSPCWSGDSGGFTTDTLALIGLNSGDTFNVRFHSAWDNSIAEPSPNWQLASVQLSNVVVNSVPEPTSLALLGLGLAGFGFLRKKKTA